MRLSLPEEAPPSASSSGMTQQSKIAAALMKAGMGNPLSAATGVARNPAPVRMAERGNGKANQSEFAKADFETSLSLLCAERSTFHKRLRSVLK